MMKNKILLVTFLFLFRFNIFSQINITKNEIINIAINEKINEISLFKKENFKQLKTKTGNKVIHGSSQNSNSLTAISIFFNKNKIETINIWIPIVNQDEIENDLAFKISDKIIHKVINEDIDSLLEWGFETDDPEQYSFYKEKITNNKKIIFFSVLPDLIVIILTTDLNLNYNNLKKDK